MISHLFHFVNTFQEKTWKFHKKEILYVILNEEPPEHGTLRVRGALRSFTNRIFVSALNKLFDSWMKTHKYHKGKRQGAAYGESDI